MPCSQSPHIAKTVCIFPVFEFRLSKFPPCPQQERAQVLKRFPSTHFKKAGALDFAMPCETAHSTVSLP